MRAPPFLAAPGGVAISRWQCGQPCPAWKRVTVPSSDTATVRGPTMGKDQGDEKSSPQGWQGRRKVEKQATRGRHAVLHEWTQGGPGGLESDRRRPSVLRLGPLAGSGWLGWGPLPTPPFPPHHQDAASRHLSDQGKSPTIRRPAWPKWGTSLCTSGKSEALGSRGSMRSGSAHLSGGH